MNNSVEWLSERNAAKRSSSLQRAMIPIAKMYKYDKFFLDLIKKIRLSLELFKVVFKTILAPGLEDQCSFH